MNKIDFYTFRNGSYSQNYYTIDIDLGGLLGTPTISLFPTFTVTLEVGFKRLARAVITTF
jgi:hypothetical protein